MQKIGSGDKRTTYAHNEIVLKVAHTPLYFYQKYKDHCPQNILRKLVINKTIESIKANNIEATNYHNHRHKLLHPTKTILGGIINMQDKVEILKTEHIIKEMVIKNIIKEMKETFKAYNNIEDIAQAPKDISEMQPFLHHLKDESFGLNKKKEIVMFDYDIAPQIFDLFIKRHGNQIHELLNSTYYGEIITHHEKDSKESK